MYLQITGKSPEDVFPSVVNQQMPELSRFYGIVIKMYYDDHNPPTFMLNTAGMKSLSAEPNDGDSRRDFPLARQIL